MIERSLAAVTLACALACGCSGDDASGAAGQDGGSGAGGSSGGAGGGAGSSGAGGAGGASGAMSGSGGSGAGRAGDTGGVGASAGDEPSRGGASATTDAMVEEDASDSGHDAGQLAPFQSIAWPSDDPVTEVDMMGAFGTDVSGITLRSGTLWMSMNLAPTKLYKMEKNGAGWRRVASDGWDAGKSLLFPDGTGIPDAEGVTLAADDSDLIYIGSERNLQGGHAATSRASVLSYDPAMAGGTLTALQEWDLTASLPAVGANLGLEAVTWIPDSQLGGFYQPSDYPKHGSGLFVVGLESKSDLYFFALGSDGSVARVATVATELAGIMGLEYDAGSGYLWAYCDNTCSNRAEILSLLPSGEFARRAAVAAPATLPNINNEGIAVAPDSECANGIKPFYWVEDGNTGGHVLRAGSVPCGAFLEAL